ncbi:hypothetical protein BKA64DRAFT_640281 [Cadophora sp. MPI-SDFR-AT-0126]|nr:hypothetical protein BKA64DRAFT_640281 [Leotiomycetes sp. MPI-SDFR-AT-0126]
MYNIFDDANRVMKLGWLRTCRHIHNQAKKMLWDGYCFHVVPGKSLDWEDSFDKFMNWRCFNYWGNFRPHSLVDGHVHWGTNAFSPEISDAIAELSRCERLKRFSFTLDSHDYDVQFGDLAPILLRVMDFRSKVQTILYLPNIRYSPPPYMPSGYLEEQLGKLSDACSHLHIIMGGEFWILENEAILGDVEIPATDEERRKLAKSDRSKDLRNFSLQGGCISRGRSNSIVDMTLLWNSETLSSSESDPLSCKSPIISPIFIESELVSPANLSMMCQDESGETKSKTLFMSLSYV